ncbi:hypothetical protein JCM16307_17910 [Thermococcus prieurii]
MSGVSEVFEEVFEPVHPLASRTTTTSNRASANFFITNIPLVVDFGPEKQRASLYNPLLFY